MAHQDLFMAAHALSIARTLLATDDAQLLAVASLALAAPGLDAWACLDIGDAIYPRLYRAVLDQNVSDAREVARELEAATGHLARYRTLGEAQIVFAAYVRLGTPWWRARVLAWFASDPVAHGDAPTSKRVRRVRRSERPMLEVVR